SIRAVQNSSKNTSSDWVSDSSIIVMPVTRTARHNVARAPCRSSSGPISGADNAANTPPSETAPDKAVRDQPNSRVSGSTKIDKVATAGALPADNAEPPTGTVRHHDKKTRHAGTRAR